MRGFLVLLVGLLIVALQITLANLPALFSIKPDFLLVFILARSLSVGSTAGVIWGFSLGLLLDTVSSNLTGLGSLAYSLVGFIAGQLGAGKTLNRLQFLLILGLTLLVANTLFFYFTEPWKEAGFLNPFLHHLLPRTGLTFFIGLIWMASPLSSRLIEKKRG